MSKKILASLIAIPVIAFGGCGDNNPHPNGTELNARFTSSKADMLGLDTKKCSLSLLVGTSIVACTFIANQRGDIDGKSLYRYQHREGSLRLKENTRYNQGIHPNSEAARLQNIAR